MILTAFVVLFVLAVVMAIRHPIGFLVAAYVLYKAFQHYGRHRGYHP